MRVLLTGGQGFAAVWLRRDLAAAGHEVISPSHAELDVTDRNAVEAAFRAARPDAIAHLAGVSFAPDALSDPRRAFEVNVGGTVAVVETAARVSGRPILLIAGSSEVYGRPVPSDLPLTERSTLAPATPYGLSKAAQEGVAITIAQERGLELVATRAFNHIGPGQRAEFAVPSFAARVAAVARGESQAVRTGNLDVRRDFTDVRDVARAYRLLLEALFERRLPPRIRVVNIASGRSVPVRTVLEGLCKRAGIAPAIQVDPKLVRPDDPPDIVGDASRLRELVGWEPEILLERTLDDLWHNVTDTTPPQ